MLRTRSMPDIMLAADGSCDSAAPPIAFSGRSGIGGAVWGQVGVPGRGDAPPVEFVPPEAGAAPGRPGMGATAARGERQRLPQRAAPLNVHHRIAAKTRDTSRPRRQLVRLSRGLWKQEKPTFAVGPFSRLLRPRVLRNTPDDDCGTLMSPRGALWVIYPTIPDFHATRASPTWVAGEVGILAGLKRQHDIRVEVGDRFASLFAALTVGSRTFCSASPKNLSVVSCSTMSMRNRSRVPVSIRGRSTSVDI